LLPYTTLFRSRHIRRVVDLHDLAAAQLDLVLHAWRGGEEIEVVFTLETFLDDLHMEQAEESAPEAEAQSGRRLRLVREGRVVQLQALEGVAKQREVLVVDREETSEDHRLGRLVAGEGLFCLGVCDRDRVADLAVLDVLQAGRDIANLA